MRTFASLVLCLSALGGCSTVGSSAIRTGATVLPAYSGEVAVYASGQRPAGAIDLGVVEVHGAQSEGTVDTLLPLFARKVAQIGGNAAMIDGVRARYTLVPQATMDTYYYRCRWAGTCASNHLAMTSGEERVLSMFGHAYRLAEKTQDKAPPAPAMEAP